MLEFMACYVSNGTIGSSRQLTDYISLQHRIGGKAYLTRAMRSALHGHTSLPTYVLGFPSGTFHDRKSLSHNQPVEQTNRNYGAT